MLQYSITSAISELELALTNHKKWAETLVFGVLAYENPSETNLMPSAHMLCKFGQWYYSQPHTTTLTQHPAIMEKQEFILLVSE